MDDSKPSIPSIEVRLRSASERSPADIDWLAAVVAKTDEPDVPERQRQSEFCRNDRANASSVGVYSGSEEEVRRGFLIALRAMGLGVVEQSHGLAIPPVARVRP